MLDLSQEEIVEGPIPRTLVILAAPLLAQNVVTVANAIVDTFWVGRLGEGAVAAVGLNFPLLALLNAVAIVTMRGCQIVVSQRTGADDVAGVRSTVFHAATLTIVLAGAVGIGVSLLAGDVVRLIGADGTVAVFAAQYLSVYAALFPLVKLSDTLENAFIGVGDSKMAMYANLTAVGFNIVADPFLIFGWGPVPELGVAGAALANGLGYVLAMLLSTSAILWWRDSLTLTRDSVGFDLARYREIVDVGFPLAGRPIAAQSVRVAVVSIVTIVGGAPGLAAYTIGARIAAVSFVPAKGLQQAAQSMIGQNLGAGRPARARRTTWVGVGIAVSALTVLGAVQWLFPVTITNLFVPDVSPRALELTTEYLRILAYGYGAIGATYLLIGGFNGASRTKTSFVVDAVKYWGIRLPVAVAALPAGYAVSALGVTVGLPTLGLGVTAIFWAVTGSNIAVAVALALYYYRETSRGMLSRAVDTVAAD